MKRLIALALLATAGCATVEPKTEPSFLTNLLAGHCGKAYEGRIVSPPTPADASFAGKRLVMHMRECSADTVRIPFHVGEDRSRTWVITRIQDEASDTRLRLKHDHRHEDGTDDATTMYGGDSVAVGTPQRQEFPVDDFSIALFEKESLPASVTNTWAMELRSGEEFVYELARPGGRLFRVEFDLTKPVAAPAAPWGDED